MSDLAANMCLNTKGGFPLVFQGDAEGNGKGVVKANSDSQSEDNGKNDKGKGKGNQVRLKAQL
jgi:hypothetical protein